MTSTRLLILVSLFLPWHASAGSFARIARHDKLSDANCILELLRSGCCHSERYIRVVLLVSFYPHN